MGWATFAGRCQRPSPTVQIPAAGSQVGGFCFTLARHRITPSGPPGLTGPAPPSGHPGALGCLGALGTRWYRIEPLSPVPIPPTTHCVPVALGEARAMAPQVGSSVYFASVVYLLCILIEDRFLALRYKTHWSFKFILEDRFKL